MTEAEVHLKLSEIKIDNDNLDYMKLVGAISGKLRYDLVKLFCQPDVIKSVCRCKGGKQGRTVDKNWEQICNVCGGS